MKPLLALLLLTACATVPEAERHRHRHLICAGPTELITDDDPGLALFEGPLPDRKVQLADARINECGPR